MVFASIRGLLVVRLVGIGRKFHAFFTGRSIIRIQLDRGIDQCGTVCRPFLNNQRIRQRDHRVTTKLQLIGIDDDGIGDLVGACIVETLLFQQGGFVFHSGFSCRITYAFPVCMVGEILGLGISKARVPAAVIHLDRIADVEGSELTCNVLDFII